MSPGRGTATRRSGSPQTGRCLKLPTPLADLANAPTAGTPWPARVVFAHRGEEWADRVEANRAVAYRIHYDVRPGPLVRGPPPGNARRSQTIPLERPRAGGVIGVDTNADHLAAWHLDLHGNPVGNPAASPTTYRHHRAP